MDRVLRPTHKRRRPERIMEEYITENKKRRMIVGNKKNNSDNLDSEQVREANNDTSEGREESLDRIDSNKQNKSNNTKKRTQIGKQEKSGLNQMSNMIRLLHKTVGNLNTKINMLTEEIKQTKTVIGSAEIAHINTETLCEAGSSTIQSPALERSVIEAVESNIVKDTLSNEESQKIIYNITNHNSIERPKFSGKGELHPVTFVEDLENYIKRESKEGKELELIQSCLMGEARDWARIYKERWIDVNSFKLDFLTTYWGENEQSELRRSIVQGVWDRKKTPSMLSHFLQLSGKARMLTYIIPEKQLIADIIRHYPKYTQQAWTIRKTETIIETAEFLRSMDLIDKQETRSYNIEGQQRKFGKEKRDIQQSYQNWQKPANRREANERVVNVVNDIGEVELGQSQGLN